MLVKGLTLVAVFIEKRSAQTIVKSSLLKQAHKQHRNLIIDSFIYIDHKSLV
jgi:hypothetical protein